MSRQSVALNYSYVQYSAITVVSDTVTLMPTVALIYGLFEGPLIAKAFIVECKRSGLTVISDASKADLIFAHSGGWMFIPEDNIAKQIILIDVAHKSDRSFVRKFGGRMAYDFRHIVPSRLFFVWLFQRIVNIWYFTSRFPIWLEMGRRYRVYDIAPLIIQPQVTVIYSDDRSWIDPNMVTHAAHYIQLDFGCHDNCWIDPSLYLNKI